MEKVLQCDNGFKVLIYMKKWLLQCCFKLFQAATKLDFPAREVVFPVFKKLVFKNKNSMGRI